MQINPQRSINTYAGATADVLCEEYKAEEELMTGRLDNNLLVHFPAEKSLLGEIVKVELTTCKGFYYLGKLCRSE